MNFYGIAFIIGLCAVSAFAEESVLTAYDLTGHHEDYYKPLKIKDALGENGKFVFKVNGFTTGATPNFYNDSFTLVYRPTRDADHLVAYFIKGGLQKLFSVDLPAEFNHLGELQKYLLSTEVYGFTPEVAYLFTPELYQLPITALYTDHIYLKTFIYLNDESPVMYVIPVDQLGLRWITPDVDRIGRYSIKSDGFEQITE